MNLNKNDKYENSEKYELDTFYIRNLIEAYRIYKSEKLIDEARSILINHSKTTLYKYLAVLGPYGYTYESLLGIWKHYVVNFLNEVEFPVDNLLCYFKGFISHLFYRIIETEGRNRRESNYSTESIDQPIEIEQSKTFKLDQVIPSDENIPRWFSMQELLEDYIFDTDSDILDASEKTLISLKMDGNSFIEISKETGFSYKQIVYIYNRAITKLKTVLMGTPKTLQNSIIF